MLMVLALTFAPLSDTLLNEILDVVGSLVLQQRQLWLVLILLLD